MTSTRAFIDFDGTTTKLSGDQFKEKYIGTHPDTQDEKNICQRLLEKLADGEMDHLILPGVVETISQLRTAGVEVYIISNNYEKFISAFLLKHGLNINEPKKIELFGHESHNDLNGEDLDMMKVEKIKEIMREKPMDVNFVFDDSATVVNKCQALQHMFAIEVITAATGKFNWQDGSYFERITTSRVKIKEIEQGEDEEEILHFFSQDSDDPAPPITLSRNLRSTTKATSDEKDLPLARRSILYPSAKRDGLSIFPPETEKNTTPTNTHLKSSENTNTDYGKKNTKAKKLCTIL